MKIIELLKKMGKKQKITVLIFAIFGAVIAISFYEKIYLFGYYYYPNNAMILNKIIYFPFFLIPDMGDAGISLIPLMPLWGAIIGGVVSTIVVIIYNQLKK